jgi:hypothetical protein
MVKITRTAVVESIYIMLSTLLTSLLVPAALTLETELIIHLTARCNYLRNGCAMKKELSVYRYNIYTYFEVYTVYMYIHIVITVPCI